MTKELPSEFRALVLLRVRQANGPGRNEPRHAVIQTYPPDSTDSDR